MKVYTREQLIKRLKISVVLSVIFALISTAAMVGLAVLAGEATVAGIMFGAVTFVFETVVYSAQFLGLTFNFRKFILGIIAPIPVVSMVIEGLKAYYYAAKALIVIFKQKDELIIGSPSEDSND